MAKLQIILILVAVYFAFRYGLSKGHEMQRKHQLIRWWFWEG